MKNIILLSILLLGIGLCMDVKFAVLSDIHYDVFFNETLDPKDGY